MVRVIHIRNRRATSVILNGIANPPKTNDLTPLVLHVFLAPEHTVGNSTRRSGTLFRQQLRIMPLMPRGKARLRPPQRLIFRRDLR